MASSVYHNNWGRPQAHRPAPPARTQAAAAPPSLFTRACADIGANLLDAMYGGEYNGKAGCHPPDLDAVLTRAFDAGAPAAAAATAATAVAARPLSGLPYGWLHAARCMAGWLDVRRLCYLS